MNFKNHFVKKTNKSMKKLKESPDFEAKKKDKILMAIPAPTVKNSTQ